MSMCEAVLDRMPAVASGRGEWTAQEQAHPASCSGCAAEWTLVQAASRMGRDVVVDAATITPVVLKQVRAAKMEKRPAPLDAAGGGGRIPRGGGGAAGGVDAGAA